MSFFKDLFGSHGGTSDALPAPTGEAALDIEIAAIFRMLADMMGTENLVIQAGKMNAMALMRSENRRERVLALMRILEEDPMLAPPPSEAEIPEIVVRMTEEIARIRVRRDLEDRIERKVTEKLEQDHEEYVEDIRRQVISEESPGAESPHDKKKREDLEALENIRLTQSVMELLRPQNFDEIIGQERAVRSLMAKLPAAPPALRTAGRRENDSGSPCARGGEKTRRLSLWGERAVCGDGRDDAALGSARYDESPARLGA